MAGHTGSTVALEPGRPARIEQRDGSTVVVKGCSRTEGAAVHAAMTALWASPVGRRRAGGPGMPQPLGFDEYTGELSTAWVAGTPLGEPGRVDGAISRAVEVGHPLAELHGSGVVVDRVRDRRELARSVGRQVASTAADPSTPGVVLEAFIEASLAVDRSWVVDEAPRRLVLSHGALTPRRVLAGDRGLVLVDFDRLQMAEPERDLAHWAAWLWVTEGAQDVPDTAELLGDLVCGYAAAARRAPADRAALEVHLAVCLVRIAHGWVALRRDPLTRVRVLRVAAALADRHPARRAGRAS
jgi:hypothetical protein